VGLSAKSPWYAGQVGGAEQREGPVQEGTLLAVLDRSGDWGGDWVLGD
jgi:hypothetical protein